MGDGKTRQAESIKTARGLFLRSKQVAFWVELLLFLSLFVRNVSFFRAFEPILFSELAEMIEWQNSKKKTKNLTTKITKDTKKRFS